MKTQVTFVCVHCPRGWTEVVDLAVDYTNRRHCGYCGEPAEIRAYVLIQPLRP